MPCMGPDCSKCPEQAKEATQKIIQMLKDDYRIFRPHEKFCFMKDSIKEYDEGILEIEKILNRIFLNDCYNSF